MPVKGTVPLQMISLLYLQVSGDSVASSMLLTSERRLSGKCTPSTLYAHIGYISGMPIRLASEKNRLTNEASQGHCALGLRPPARQSYSTYSLSGTTSRSTRHLAASRCQESLVGLKGLSTTSMSSLISGKQNVSPKSWT